MSTFGGKCLSVFLIQAMVLETLLPIQLTAAETATAILSSSAASSPTVAANPFATVDFNKIAQNYAGACTSVDTAKQAIVQNAMDKVGAAVALPKDQAGDLASQLQGLQAGPIGACSGPEPVKTKPACSMFSAGSASSNSSAAVNLGKMQKILDDPNGGFSQSGLQAVLGRNAQAMSKLTCQEGRLKALGDEMKCIQDAASKFAQQVTPLAQLYQTNISQMQSDVNKLKAEVSDREQQETEVSSRLQGDRNSGRKGLVEVRDGVKALVTKMNQDIDGSAGIRTMLRNLENQKDMLAKQERGLADKIQTETLTEAKKCFSDVPDPNFKEEANGPSTTMKKYMHAMYSRSFERSREEDAARSRRAGGLNALVNNRSSDQRITKGGSPGESRALSLDLLIDQFFNSDPVSPTAGGSKAPAGSLIKVGSDGYPQVSDEFINRTRAYTDTGLGIPDFLKNGLNSCLKIARRRIAAKRNRLAKVSPGSNPQQPQLADPDSVEGVTMQVEQGKRSLLEAREQIRTKSADLLNEYSHGGQNGIGFNDAMRSLTGLNLPVNASACKDAAPEVQVGCLQDFRNNMNEIMAGTGKAGQISMVIPGQQAKNTISLTCAGLDGCITALQNVKTNLPKEKMKVQQFTKDYIQKSNGNVQKFTKDAQEKMGKVNAQLQQQLSGLQTALASLGLKARLKPKDKKPEELQQDRESCMSVEVPKGPDSRGGGGGETPACLFQPPRDIQSFLGTLDLNDAFGEAGDALGKKKEDIEKAKGEIASANVEIQTKFEECANEAKDKAKQKLGESKETSEKLVKELGEAKSAMKKACTQKEYCKGYGEEISKLSENLSGIVENVAGMDNASSVLSGRIQDYCGDGNSTESSCRNAHLVCESVTESLCSEIVTRITEPKSPNPEKCITAMENIRKISEASAACESAYTALKAKGSEVESRARKLGKGADAAK